jgi:hypothetical protein
MAEPRVTVFLEQELEPRGRSYRDCSNRRHKAAYAYFSMHGYALSVTATTFTLYE